MNSKVLQLPKNLRGRDFVVGDIHFKTTDLHRGLHALGFDKTKDRLIAVGDLIDRGPGVLDGLKLLSEPWFFSVQGNHERMLIDAYDANSEARYSAHGAGWWMTIADESKAMIIGKLRSLPVAIEVESDRGTVGVVHADVPAGMAWPTFLEQLDNHAMEEIALWGRDRIVKHHREGVLEWRQGYRCQRLIKSADSCLIASRPLKNSDSSSLENWHVSHARQSHLPYCTCRFDSTPCCVLNAAPNTPFSRSMIPGCPE